MVKIISSSGNYGPYLYIERIGRIDLSDVAVRLDSSKDTIYLANLLYSDKNLSSNFKVIDFNGSDLEEILLLFKKRSEIEKGSQDIEGKLKKLKEEFKNQIKKHEMV